MLKSTIKETKINFQLAIDEANPNRKEVLRSLSDDKYGFKGSLSDYVGFNDYIIDKVLNGDLPDLFSADAWQQATPIFNWQRIQANKFNEFSPSS
ncbi:MULTISPECIES: hypothetical protein [unclassified Prochlorococcus]|uniref:hypothetical protein n=1 Tax=unclassified Prochlorococcus TaxID=2627481 RepID=UPI0005338071|nr:MULTISPECIES: hypothetical protein [unclassified Prochlorococcus]KGG25070.1 hypothetical protein EV12_2950 [Prochlorococcus sp. MIT 0701]KGG26222.1 hypothetical protein EV13_3004 [Prochlorococcus sp. MIT 0702]KGG33046.1 hypothetical protein EV14_1887 [Prochlorococcus sp. MIT 0703]